MCLLLFKILLNIIEDDALDKKKRRIFNDNRINDKGYCFQQLKRELSSMYHEKLNLLQFNNDKI